MPGDARGGAGADEGRALEGVAGGALAAEVIVAELGAAPKYGAPGSHADDHARGVAGARQCSSSDERAARTFGETRMAAEVSAFVSPSWRFVPRANWPLRAGRKSSIRCRRTTIATIVHE